jgi:uncharacterized surface protein with fasciclin (FAS1) repeats
MTMTCPFRYSRILTRVLILIACLAQTAFTMNEPIDAASPDATHPETSALSIPEALVAAGFTKFAKAIESAGLTGTLQGKGPFTCFAPSDEAFAAMPDKIKKLLKEDPAGEQAQAWIKYHFTEGVALKRDDLMEIPGAVSFSGHHMLVWVSLDKISINRICEIIRSDIVAANGVIHGVDRVLDTEDEKAVYQRNAPER